MIKVEGISYQIGRRKILHDISFEVMPGEVVAILGSNGAGKSTLLKILGGELKTAPGFINIAHKDILHWQPQELAKRRAVLQQHTALTLPFTVGEVVMMGRYPHFGNKPCPADHVIVKAALKKTGVEHLAGRNYLTLSGGEQQRTHLARVFAQVWFASRRETRYLLMDEPVNSLDIRHQHTTLQLAREFAKDGNCVVAVLHDLNLAMQYADKVLMLRNGEITGFGDTRKILNSDTISHTYDFPLHVLDHAYDTYPVIIPAFTNNKITT